MGFCHATVIVLAPDDVRVTGDGAPGALCLGFAEAGTLSLREPKDSALWADTRTKYSVPVDRELMSYFRGYPTLKSDTSWEVPDVPEVISFTSMSFAW